MPSEAKQAGTPHWLRVLIIGRSPRRTLIRLIVLVVGCYIVFGYSVSLIQVTGISMLPTYHENSVHAINRLAYIFSEPRRRDVVAIRFSGRSLVLLKRIIGLPGETVEFKNGHAVVNGKILDEPYVKFPCNWDSPPVKLGSDDYYFVGDNRSMLEEDHEKGRTYRERIIGKLVL